MTYEGSGNKSNKWLVYHEKLFINNELQDEQLNFINRKRPEN
jgi:hypothetical protein